ncbi:MAG: hypothetical protein FJX76_09930 [Armatimonadetes bacterium]|nr:hypothetical protein [Armatimonadota bacterium]
MQVLSTGSNLPMIAARTALPTAAMPLDQFTPSLGGAASAGFVHMLGIRVPTVTPEYSAEKRKHILDNIQPGDVILETNNAYPGWQRLEFYTLRSSYTHAAIYEGNGKFLEATTPGGVQRTDLADYLTGRIQVAIIRPDYKSPTDVTSALDYCRGELGKPYDNKFNTHGNDEIYCAELVYKALKQMPNPIEAPTRKVFGKEAVGPDAFFEIPNAKVIHDDGSAYWKNRLSNWPVYLTAATAATVAGMHAGPWAGTAGFFGGLFGAILVGNKIQTGHFNLAGDSKR